ncbi:MAG: Ig-like domain-containing protein, partial [Thermoflexales bacterium]|nr:Ig-like domain-containing protein [Thermoflexales bacterium]
MAHFRSLTAGFVTTCAALVGLAAWLSVCRPGLNPYAAPLDGPAWEPAPAYAPLRSGVPGRGSVANTSPLATPTVGTQGEKRPAVAASPTSTPAAVIAYEPGGSRVRSTSTITLTFNCPMKSASVEQRFALRRVDLPAGETAGFIPGYFSWPEANVLVFTPKTSLVDGAGYSVTLEKGAQPRQGTPTQHTSTYTFSVLPLPEMTRSSPRDGDMEARLKDRVTLSFNLPMDTEAVERALRIWPEPAEPPRLEWNKAATTLDVVFDVDPSAFYTILLGNEAVDAWGRALHDNRSIVFRAAPLEPVTWLVGPRGYWNEVYGTYNPNPQVRQYTQFRNVEALSYRLSQVSRQDFLALFQPAWGNNKKPPTSTLISTWMQTVTAPLNKLGLDLAHISLPDGSPLPSGAYLLEVEGSPGKAHDWRMVIVSPLNLALKRSDKQTFVWATDLRTGRSVSGLRMAVYDMDKTLVTRGETNDAGVFKTDQSPKCLDRWECAYGWRPLYVVAEGEGEEWGFVASTWDEGIATRDFQMPYYYGEPSHTIFLY